MQIQRKQLVQALNAAIKACKAEGNEQAVTALQSFKDDLVDFPRDAEFDLAVVLQLVASDGAAKS